MCHEEYIKPIHVRFMVHFAHMCVETNIENCFDRRTLGLDLIYQRAMLPYRLG